MLTEAVTPLGTTQPISFPHPLSVSVLPSFGMILLFHKDVFEAEKLEASFLFVKGYGNCREEMLRARLVNLNFQEQDHW